MVFVKPKEEIYEVEKRLSIGIGADKSPPDKSIGSLFNEIANVVGGLVLIFVLVVGAAVLLLIIAVSLKEAEKKRTKKKADSTALISPRVTRPHGEILQSPRTRRSEGERSDEFIVRIKRESAVRKFMRQVAADKERYSYLKLERKTGEDDDSWFVRLERVMTQEKAKEAALAKKQADKVFARDLDEIRKQLEAITSPPSHQASVSAASR